MDRRLLGLVACVVAIASLCQRSTPSPRPSTTELGGLVDSATISTSNLAAEQIQG